MTFQESMIPNDPNDPTAQPTSAKAFVQADIDRIVGQVIARERAEADRKIVEAQAQALAEASRSAQDAQQAALAALKRRETDISRRELRAIALESLCAKDLPRGLSEVLDYSDAQRLASSIECVETAFREAVRAGVESRIKAPAPKAGAGIAGTAYGLSAQGQIKQKLEGLIEKG